MSDNHEEAAYYLRFIRMYIDLATDAVLKVFFHLSPSQNVDTLFASDDVKKNLEFMRKTNILSRREYELVSRPHIRPASFDLSLLITLLTNLFSGKLTSPKNGWKLPVAATDISIAADLLRLREIRNKILAHQPSAKLIKSKFERLWEDVKNILVRLIQQVDSNYVSTLEEKIIEYENTPLDPHDSFGAYLDTFQEWFDEVLNLQVEVEELSNKLKELHLYFKTKPARYSRYIRLLFEGGKLVLCGLLKRLLPERGQTLHVTIQSKCSKLRERIGDEELLKQLFPNASDMAETNLDINKWDIAVLACVVICILNDDRNSEDVINDVTIILKARKSYADSALVALDNEKFSTVSEDLLMSISMLSSRLDVHDRKRFREIIATNKNENDETYFEELKSHGSGIKSIVDTYNETLSKLKDYLKVMEDTGIPFQKYHILDLKIVTLGNDEEKRKVVEDSVATVWQAALERSGNPSDFPTVRESLDIILNDIRRIPDVEMGKLGRHCIMFSLKCKSLRAIFQLIEYFESSTFKQQLQAISIEVSLLQDEVISLQGHLTLESLLDILNRPQAGDDTGNTLCVPIKCSSVTGMKEVLKVLSNEDTTNRFNQIADTLSEREISLKVFPEVYGFKEVFLETDSGSGGSSCEEEKDGLLFGKQFIPDGPAAKAGEARISTAEADDSFAEKEKVISEENCPALFQVTKYKDQHQQAIEMEKKKLKLQTTSLCSCDYLFLAGENPQLESCEIRDEMHSHKVLSTFSSGISRAVNLKTLKLRRIECSDSECEGHVIDLSKHQKLQSVTILFCNSLLLSDINPHLESCEIWRCKYSHEMLSSFLTRISRPVNLKTLSLDSLVCSDSKCEDHVIDLSKHEKLQSVRIWYCNSLLLSDINPHLESCEIQQCKFSHKMLSSFLSGISRPVNLKTLKLRGIECSDSKCEGHVIDLSKHKKLQSVTIEDCNCFLLSDIIPHLESCDIRRCKFSHEMFSSFLSGISRPVNVKTLKLYEIKCSDSDCKGHVIDLSKQEFLQNVKIEDCNRLLLSDKNPHLESCEILRCEYSHEILSSFLSSISRAVNLKTLKLHSLICSDSKCEDHVIDLSKLEKFQSVTIEECKSVLLSDINPSLESCTISGLGHESLLSLSSFISCAINLQKLILKNVHCLNRKCDGHVIDFANLRKLKQFAIIGCDNLYVKNLKSVLCLNSLEISFCKFSHEQWLLISKAVELSGLSYESSCNNTCSSKGCKGHILKMFGQTHILTRSQRSRAYHFHKIKSQVPPKGSMSNTFSRHAKSEPSKINEEEITSLSDVHMKYPYFKSDLKRSTIGDKDREKSIREIRFDNYAFHKSSRESLSKAFLRKKKTELSKISEEEIKSLSDVHMKYPYFKLDPKRSTIGDKDREKSIREIRFNNDEFHESSRDSLSKAFSRKKKTGLSEISEEEIKSVSDVHILGLSQI